MPLAYIKCPYCKDAKEVDNYIPEEGPKDGDEYRIFCGECCNTFYCDVYMSYDFSVRKP